MRTLLKKLWLPIALLLTTAVVVACQPQTVELPVEVTRVVTQTETVVETVIEEVEVEVTRVIEVEVEVEVPVELIPQADPGKLVVYSGRSETLVGPIIRQFAEATGIDVQVRYGNTAEVAATILEEGRNSPADVFFAQDPGGLAAVADAGFLTELPSDILEKVPPRFRSEDGQWVGISGRARTLVYNVNNVPADELPQSLEELTDPKWRGRIGWAPTNGSFQAMVSVMRNVWGEEATREWLRGIQANEPQVYPNNTSQVEAAGRGEIDIGLVNHYYLYRFLAESGESFGARNHFIGDGGPGALILTAGAGILETSPNPDNAERFMQFMLSVPAQQYFASQTFEYPVVEGVLTASLLTPLAELDAVAIDVPLSMIADLQATAEMLRDLGLLE
jgi:iron(III) transport system substrate-binding protein